jgi:hypothetical protein
MHLAVGEPTHFPRPSTVEKSVVPEYIPQTSRSAQVTGINAKA